MVQGGIKNTSEGIFLNTKVQNRVQGLSFKLPQTLINTLALDLNLKVSFFTRHWCIGAFDN